MLYSRLAYTALMMVAMAVAAWMLSKAGPKSLLSPLEKMGLGIGGMVGATFGAKLPFLLSGAMTHGLFGTWFADGKTILWALAGGYAGVEIAKWSLLIRMRTGDTFVVPVAVAIAIGRMGCLAYGCCYGKVSDVPWALSFVAAPDAGTMPRHPIQLYEAAFHLGFAILAASNIRRGLCMTQWMLIYLASYCLFRFATEFFRPEPVWLFGLTFYQISCLGFGVVFTGLLIHRRSRPSPSPA